MKRIYIFINLLLFIGIGCSGSGDNGGIPQGNLTYTAPSGWVEQQPSSSMRFAQYSLPGQEGMAAAELAVFFNIGGSIEANLQRWNGQFSQPDGRSTSDVAETNKVPVGNLEVTVTYITGTFLASAAMSGSSTNKPGFAMLAAMVETSQGPWQFKATGPEVTVSYWRDSFDEFVRGFKVN